MPIEAPEHHPSGAHNSGVSVLFALPHTVPTSISESNLPGLRSAASSLSGSVVVASTSRPQLGAFSCTSSVANNLASPPQAAAVAPRATPINSMSSISNSAGAAARAVVKADTSASSAAKPPTDRSSPAPQQPRFKSKS
eukprot:scaffold7086_cov120-Isochrysis_galbana.AAC.4